MMNTVFGYSLFAFFIYLNVHYSMAVLLSTVLGVLFNFKSIGRLVFKNKNNALIYKFIGVYILTYLLNVAALRLFNTYHVNMYLAGALLLVPITLISFTLHNNVVFKERVSHACD
jgi:putative flippase GtrA